MWRMYLEGYSPAVLIAGGLLLCLFVGFFGSPLFVWTILAALALQLVGVGQEVWIGFFVVAAIFNIPPIRQQLVSRWILQLFKALKFIPQISQTERTALEAGVVWAEGELFSGKPNFKTLLAENYPRLNAEEQAFIDGPVKKLCGMIDDWKVFQDKQIPQDAWDYLRREKFLGMIIPKEYGGLGFSAMAHSEVIKMLASRSLPTCITVMVPNSLGPAELLVHYGTEEQKKQLLPRLATGEDIPCFALTEPTAGSDAGSIQAEGILFKGEDGKLYIKLNWNKRWITLAAISTVLGLAFRLKDPSNILGKGEDVGITCALIPSKTPGVVLGKRHDPLGIPFYNCPTQGKDVIVSVDTIVGGIGGAGNGWTMLMECLAAGRGVSLPAQSAGGSELGTRVVTNHAIIRKQFGVSIAKFEGVEEALARIGGLTYTIEAFRRYTLGALDKGIKPPVVTAIAKYHSTELGRKIVNDCMDVLGGAGISRGPRNLVSNMYVATPIGITVEGANILTRTLIIFGQGALRAHPYAFKEVDAVEKGDVKAFDSAFWGHIGHVVRNMCRSILLSCTRGHLAPSPVSGATAKYYRRLSWASASFAIMADIAMGTLGGKLKIREKMTGRFADILSWMYIGTAILRRFEAEGRRKEDVPFVHYSMNYCLNQIQDAFDGIFFNMEVPGLSWFFKGPIRIWSGINVISSKTSDHHTHKISTLITQPGEQRDRITSGIYYPTNPNDALAQQEAAFQAVTRAESIESKIRQGVKAGKVVKAKGAKLVENAVAGGVITQDEAVAMKKAEQIRYEAIQVDDFTEAEYRHTPQPATMGHGGDSARSGLTNGPSKVALNKA
jgi:acyl-CoA dehydrogenase